MPNTPFDLCILTAAHEHQARGYDTQLQWRRERGQLPDTEFVVFPDPDGQRIGSGGSTLYVLDQLRRTYGADVFHKRILLLHSGGDSRRLLAYSAVGKLFTPLPTPDDLTLFDIMIDNYAQLPALPDGQVVVASGDVLLNFEPGFVEFSPHGITGVAYPEDPKEGQYFGVYVVEEDDQRLKPLTDVLQKPDVAELETAGALRSSQRIWIDTGILNVAPDALEHLLRCETLLHSFERGELNYNLYHEILHAIHGKLHVPDAEYLTPISLSVNCLPYCGFYHVGRSAELLQNFYALTHASVHYQFQNGVRSNAADAPELKSTWVYNSMINSVSISAQRPALIEGCAIASEVSLAGHNIVTGLVEVERPLRLESGQCLLMLPQEDGTWAAMVYGINDHFKSGADETFLNVPMRQFFRDRGIAATDLWEGDEDETLWTARVFPVAATPQAALEAMFAIVNGSDMSRWRNSSRQSIEHIVQHADQLRMLQHRAELLRQFTLYDLTEHLQTDALSYHDLQSLIRTPADVDEVLNTLKSQIDRVDIKKRAQLQFWIAELSQSRSEDESEAFYADAFQSIRDSVKLGLRTHETLREPSFRIRTDEVVWTLLPARLDFAGGWTDTPPICLDMGGSVLNASVTLNGQYPIQVVGKIRPNDYVISINSIDLGQRADITSLDELRDFSNPSDWLSLPKAAMYAAGIFPLDLQSSLSDVLKQLGGGIDLTLFSALPSGSGLGTSSILGAGCIATLSRIFGGEMPRDELYARTSNLEQLMSTGGGWQDQIGGVAGGVKLITTQAGFDQTPTLAWTHWKQPHTDLSEQYVLYYTGYRRMAKNLLRQVVGRYLKRDAEALDTLRQLRDLAHEMKEDLDHRRIDAFGRNIRRAWALNKALDRGQTTDAIEAILRRVDDYILGAKLLGAGGGGFLFMVTKDKHAAQRIRELLQAAPPNDRARFFDFDVDAGGMRCSVL